MIQDKALSTSPRAPMYNQGMARLEQPVRTATSFEEFLEFERSSPVRHEFIDGNLFVMAGGTDRHNQLAIRAGQPQSQDLSKRSK